jgi:hypothetical protein
MLKGNALEISSKFTLKSIFPYKKICIIKRSVFEVFSDQTFAGLYKNHNFAINHL